MGESVQKLEGQVDELLSLYDFGERLHNYSDLHGEQTLNENERRQNMVSFLGSRGTSSSILQGCSLFGVAAMYIYSRRGAASIMDLNRLRACGWTSASVFMVGSTFGCMYNMIKEKHRLDTQEINLETATRVAQNEQTHALLRTMKFHLQTRQMGLFD